MLVMLLRDSRYENQEGKYDWYLQYDAFKADMLPSLKVVCVLTLLLRGSYTVVTLLLHCHNNVVTLLLHCCYTADTCNTMLPSLKEVRVVPLLLHCCHTVVTLVTLLLHCCDTAVTLL
jgi:uncharacterized membrane protein YadS